MKQRKVRRIYRAKAFSSENNEWYGPMYASSILGALVWVYGYVFKEPEWPAITYARESGVREGLTATKRWEAKNSYGEIIIEEEKLWNSAAMRHQYIDRDEEWV